MVKLYDSVESIINSTENKKQSILMMYASALYIQALNPKFVALTSVLDMFRDGDDKNDVTKRLSKLMGVYLKDINGAYNKTETIYSVRSEYIHQGIGQNISANKETVNELCIRAIWKMLNPKTNLNNLEKDCENNVEYHYFWEE